MSVYVYVIDAANRIISVSDNWLSFARENQAGESCHPDKVINVPIWNFITGIETTHLYEIIIDAVRTKRKTVTLPYRCDAPDRRRYLELRISPLELDHVEFFSRILSEEPRDAVELLATDTPRSDRIIIICSMCKKVKLTENDWMEVETAVAAMGLFDEPSLPQISHGFCPECREMVLARMGQPDD